MLAARGYAITIVTNASPSDASRLPADWDVISAGPRARLLQRSALKLTALGWALRRVIRREQPELVVVQHPVYALLAGPAARRAGIPVLAVVNSLVHEEIRLRANSHRWATTLLSLAGERRLRHATLVVPPSGAFTRPLEILGVPPDRITLVPSPVDTDTFRPSDGPRDIDALYVGRLSPEKGPQDLLAACRLLPPDVRVTVAGSGRMRDELERMASRAACRVEFTGYVGRDDLPALYRRARLVVIPSRTEALPRVALEAMASGVPVVASRVGGIPDVVQPGTTGWLVEPGNVDELARSITDALAADLEVMGRAARRRALDFAPDAFARRFVEVAEHAIARTPRAR